MKAKWIKGTVAGCVVLAGALFMAAVPARAQDRTPRVNQMQRRQEMRIRHGVRSGQLTPRQAHRLQRGEARLQARKAADKAEGPLTSQERTQLRGEARRQNRRIGRAERKNLH